MRRVIAGFLLALTTVLSVVMGLVAGIGVTVVLVILVIDKTISIGLGLLIFFLGLPAIEGVVMLANTALCLGLVMIARLFDREEVDQWDPA